MSDSLLQSVLAPIVNSRRRKLISLIYRNPLDFVRRGYLHLEQTIFKRRKALMLPARVKLNTGYVCNLECPLCPTGRREARPLGHLTAAMTKFLLLRLKRAKTISLFGWAEPFLNPEIFDIIVLLKKSRRIVVIDTNLSINNPQIIERVAHSPIDMLSVSLDGADEATYSTYRVGGSFDLVIRNIRRLKASTDGPRRIQWQYLVSRKNHHLIDRAKALGTELGVEMYFMDIGMYSEMFYESSDEVKREWWTDEQRERLDKPSEKRSSDACIYMYNDPFIDFNGDVYPCCHAPYAPKEVVAAGFQNVFGNLERNSLGEIWNNANYQSARSLFSDGHPPTGQAKVICQRCKVYLSRVPNRSGEKLPIFNGTSNPESDSAGARAPTPDPNQQLVQIASAKP